MWKPCQPLIPSSFRQNSFFSYIPFPRLHIQPPNSDPKLSSQVDLPINVRMVWSADGQLTYKSLSLVNAAGGQITQLLTQQRKHQAQDGMVGVAHKGSPAESAAWLEALSLVKHKEVVASWTQEPECPVSVPSPTIYQLSVLGFSCFTIKQGCYNHYGSYVAIASINGNC